MYRVVGASTPSALCVRSQLGLLTICWRASNVWSGAVSHTLSKARNIKSQRQYTVKASAKAPIPIILCGKTSNIAVEVTKLLKPEIEVIHANLSVPSFITSAPLLLQRTDLLPSQLSSLKTEANIGSQNYNTQIQAIVTGGAFNDEMIAEMKAAVEGAGSEGLRRVPWLRPDMTKKKPPLGPEYVKFVALSVKECLLKLENEGALKADVKEGEAKVYYF